MHFGKILSMYNAYVSYYDYESILLKSQENNLHFDMTNNTVVHE